MGELTAKQRLFVDEYLVDLNATQAAIRAGYSEKTAEQQAYQLLQKTSVQRAISDAVKARAERTGIDQDRVVDELAKIAFADMAHYVRFDGANAYIDFSAMPASATAAISEIVVDEYTVGRGDDAREVKRVRFKLHAKQAALDALLKHLDQSDLDSRLRAIEERFGLQ